MTYVPDPGPRSETPPPQPPQDPTPSTPPPQEQPTPGKRGSGCATTASVALVFLVAVGFAVWHVFLG